MKTLPSVRPLKLSAITLFIRSGLSNATLIATYAPPLVPNKLTFFNEEKLMRVIVCFASSNHRFTGNLSMRSDLPCPKKSKVITLYVSL